MKHLSNTTHPNFNSKKKRLKLCIPRDDQNQSRKQDLTVRQSLQGAQEERVRQLVLTRLKAVETEQTLTRETFP